MGAGAISSIGGTGIEQRRELALNANDTSSNLTCKAVNKNTGISEPKHNAPSIVGDVDCKAIKHVGTADTGTGSTGGHATATRSLLTGNSADMFEANHVVPFVESYRHAGQAESVSEFGERVCEYAEELFAHSGTYASGLIRFKDMRDIIMEILQCFSVNRELAPMIVNNLNEILQVQGDDDQMPWEEARYFLHAVCNSLMMAKNMS